MKPPASAIEKKKNLSPGGGGPAENDGKKHVVVIRLHMFMELALTA